MRIAEGGGHSARDLGNIRDAPQTASARCRSDRTARGRSFRSRVRWQGDHPESPCAAPPSTPASRPPALPGCVMAERAATPQGEAVTVVDSPDQPNSDAPARLTADLAGADDGIDASGRAGEAGGDKAASAPAPLLRPDSVPMPKPVEPPPPAEQPMATSTPSGGRHSDPGLPTVESLPRGPAHRQRKLAVRPGQDVCFHALYAARDNRAPERRARSKEAVSAGINPLIDARGRAFLAIDVDTGSWTLAKRFLQDGSLPNVTRCAWRSGSTPSLSTAAGRLAPVLHPPRGRAARQAEHGVARRHPGEGDREARA